MLTIHPPSFIETEDCGGIRYVRGQPSRENPGILMSEIQNKYVTEFELPYRNVLEYIKEVGNSWNRLNEDQKKSIRQSFKTMGLASVVGSNMERFEGSSEEEFNGHGHGHGRGDNYVNRNVGVFIKYLASDPENNVDKFMNAVWKSNEDTRSQMNVSKDDMYHIKDSMYAWSVDNTYSLHSNWRSGLILFFFLLIIIILIAVAASKKS